MIADILSFLEGRAFAPEDVRIMGQAYDKARGMLQDRGQPHLVEEVIAKRVIDIASTGERDPDVLARQALRSLGLGAEKP